MSIPEFIGITSLEFCVLHELICWFFVSICNIVRPWTLFVSLLLRAVMSNGSFHHACPRIYEHRVLKSLTLFCNDFRFESLSDPRKILVVNAGQIPYRHDIIDEFAWHAGNEFKCCCLISRIVPIEDLSEGVNHGLVDICQSEEDVEVFQLPMLINLLFSFYASFERLK